MHSMVTKGISEKHRIVWNHYGFKNLLVWLLVYLVIGPFLESVPYAETLMSVFLTVVLLSAVCAVNKESNLLSVAMVLITLALAFMWLGKVGVVTLSPALFSGLLVVYLGTLVYSFLVHILAARRVTTNAICAALCLYLVLGLLWGALFGLLEWWAPNSFAGGLLEQSSSAEQKRDCLNYFSFVTLSTVGYGDITPQTHAAAALCQARGHSGPVLHRRSRRAISGARDCPERNRRHVMWKSRSCVRLRRSRLRVLRGGLSISSRATCSPLRVT